ncbi:hypothetical protein ERUR111494_08130 [Erysipelothrix urinaevulpis]|uniref:hypothetical protein n=1 Tax=Erysipelothrix urinaevulpis TaxID=2683717 RepID=UPI0013596C81|nr:hypothetical protein [Erysipelothrix urinaevulpis]
MKKILSLIFSLTIILSITSSVLAEETILYEANIILENGDKIIEQEFVDLLEAYEGEVYEIYSDVIFINESVNNGIQMASEVLTLSMNNIIKFMGGEIRISILG